MKCKQCGEPLQLSVEVGSINNGMCRACQAIYQSVKDHRAHYPDPPAQFELYLALVRTIDDAIDEWDITSMDIVGALECAKAEHIARHCGIYEEHG